MKIILITGAGGSAAVNFIRSLRLSGENFYFIGVDSNKFSLQRAETEEKFLVPEAKSPYYPAVIKEIIKKTRADFIYAPPDVEIGVLSEVREELGTKTFWPSKETIIICMNKYQSYEIWNKAGLKVPKTMMITTEDDLRIAFAKIDKKIWVRAVSGAFGKGSLPTDQPELAKCWIDFHKGWGRFCASECLGQRTVTWQSIWEEGELVVAQARERLYWEFANRSPSGVTGLTGAGVTVSDAVVDETAQKAIFAIDKKPHGIFSVDFTYDSQNFPNPTEINIGRFFTTHLFFSMAGLNMPYILVKLAFGEPYPVLEKKINPLKPGLAWIRGLDFEPILTDLESINSYEEQLSARIMELSQRESKETIPFS